MWATWFIWALHARNTVSVHDYIWSLYTKADCNSFRIKKILLCNKFHCFHNCQTLAFNSTAVPRISDIVRRKQAQKSHWVTCWLKLFVIFQLKKIKYGYLFLFPNVSSLDSVICRLVSNCLYNFINLSEPLKSIHACLYEYFIKVSSQRLVSFVQALP